MIVIQSASSVLHVDTTRSTWPTASVAVTGNVDLENAPLLVAQLLTVLGTRAPGRLLVDFSGVDFLDCAGIGALVTVRNAALSIGCRMRLANTAPSVRRILALTFMLDIFTVPDDLAAPRPPDPPAGRRRPTAQAPVGVPMPRPAP